MNPKVSFKILIPKITRLKMRERNVSANTWRGGVKNWEKAKCININEFLRGDDGWKRDEDTVNQFSQKHENNSIDPHTSFINTNP